MISSKKQQKHGDIPKETIMICKLLFFYGVMQCVRFGFQTINHFFLEKHIWNTWVNLLKDMIFVVCFLQTYKKKEFFKEPDLLAGICVWGMLESILPFVMFVIRMLLFWICEDYPLNTSPILEQCKMVIELFLVCYITSFYGIVFKQKWMILIAIIWLGMFSALYALEMNVVLLGIYPLIYIVLSVILFYKYLH